MLSRCAEVLHLAAKNKHARDACITFVEEGHMYFVNGVRMSMSVTALIQTIESDPFNGPLVAARIAGSSRPNPKYSIQHADGTLVPLTAPEIVARWDFARDLGTELHGMIERFLNDLPVTVAYSDENAFTFGQFLQWVYPWMAKTGCVPYRTEWTIYDEEAELAGSIDCVMFNPATNKYRILDWKRCETAEPGFKTAYRGRTFLPPLDDIFECKCNHWAVQTNMYAEILERNYGIEVEALGMVVFHPGSTAACEYWHLREDAAQQLLYARLEQLGKRVPKQARIDVTDPDI